MVSLLGRDKDRVYNMLDTLCAEEIAVHTRGNFETRESFARFQPIPQHLDLLGELLPLDTRLFTLPSNARNLIERHFEDRQRGQDAVQGGNQLALYHLDGYVVDETLQRNLTFSKESVKRQRKG